MVNRDDFALSDEQLTKINDYIAEQARAYAAADEVPDGVSVIFSFTPIGRFVDLRYDSQYPVFSIE